MNEKIRFGSTQFIAKQTASKDYLPIMIYCFKLTG
jgi:hypothetical protein